MNNKKKGKQQKENNNLTGYYSLYLLHALLILILILSSIIWRARSSTSSRLHIKHTWILNSYYTFEICREKFIIHKFTTYVVLEWIPFVCTIWICSSLSEPFQRRNEGISYLRSVLRKVRIRSVMLNGGYDVEW